MPRRVYGAPSAVNVNADPVIVESNSVSAEPLAESVKPRWRLSFKHKILICLGLIAFISIGSCLFYFNAYDSKYGNEDPFELAEDYSVSMILRQDDIYDHLPREVRSVGFMSADTAWIGNSVWQNVQVDSVSVRSDKADIDLSDRIDALGSGLKDIYRVDIDIESAKVIKMTADVIGTYLNPGAQFYETFEFEVIVVKVGHKWYVYTGNGSAVENIKLVPDVPVEFERNAAYNSDKISRAEAQE